MAGQAQGGGCEAHLGDRFSVTLAQGQMVELVPAGHWQLVAANCLYTPSMLPPSPACSRGAPDQARMAARSAVT